MPLVRTALPNPSKMPKGKGEKRQERGAGAVAGAVAGDLRVEREEYGRFSTHLPVFGFMSPPSSSGIFAVVACARGAGAVYRVCAEELVAHGFVNTGFPGRSWVQHVSVSFCHFLRPFGGYRGRRVPVFLGEWEDGK